MSADGGHTSLTRFLVGYADHVHEHGHAGGLVGGRVGVPSPGGDAITASPATKGLMTDRDHSHLR
jgi:hypothetical protein